MITASHLLTLLGLIMCNYFIQPLYQCFSVQIFNMNRNEEKGENEINHASSKANHIYLLFDPVHLLKNIRNNLFKSINYQPIWKKHLNCRIKQCIVKITKCTSWSIFDQSTSAAIKSYYPSRLDASSFLKLVNICWTINNSKQELNTN